MISFRTCQTHSSDIINILVTDPSFSGRSRLWAKEGAGSILLAKPGFLPLDPPLSFFPSCNLKENISNSVSKRYV